MKHITVAVLFFLFFLSSSTYAQNDIRERFDDNFMDMLELYEAKQKFYDQEDYDGGIEILTSLIERGESKSQYPAQLLSLYYGTRSIGWARKGEYSLEAADLQHKLDLLEKMGEEGRPELSSTWYGLAGCYYYLGDQEKTMHAANQSVANALAYYGKQHSQTINALDHRSNYEGFYGLKDSALLDRKHIFQSIQNNVEQNFTYLTESERTAYWNKQLPKTTIMFAFAHRFGDWQSSFTDELYNQQLLSKGLLLTTENALQRAIENDPDLQQTYLRIRQLRLSAMEETMSPAETESALREADRLERSLGEKANSIHNFLDFIKTHFDDIKTQLKSNEVAIEFTDYRIGKDSTMYAALIMSPLWEHVRFVPLIEAKEIDVNYDRLSQQIWNPILKVIPHGVENIYFAPSGLLYQLPLESLPLENGKPISSIFRLYRMSSTRWLAINDNGQPGNDAVVFGGLEYDMSVKDMQADATRHTQQKEAEYLSFSIRSAINDIPYLEGTKNEAETIIKTINDASLPNFHATLYLGNQGTEAAFKALDGKHKRVIHVATHGFYHPEDSLTDSSPDNVLIRSGLYLAGANNKYIGEEIPEGIEDGFLTSLEIASLDLSGLDLIVMSACETGMGKISSDGVFGLQRGFKKAGANSILMSLWKVNDQATCLLMTEFYKNWMAGMSKYDALESAKQSVRSHTEKGWDNPNFWAAFILLDGLD